MDSPEAWRKLVNPEPPAARAARYDLGDEKAAELLDVLNRMLKGDCRPITEAIDALIEARVEKALDDRAWETYS